MTARPEPGVRLSRRHLLLLAATVPAAACTDQEGPSRPGASLLPGAGSGSPSGGTPKPLPVGGGPVRYTPGKVMLGAYLDLDGLSLRQSLALRRRQLGRQPRILHVFYAWKDDLPSRLPETPSGSTLLISWRGTYYDEINSGSADRHIARTARRLAGARKPIMLRWGWEMNGDWYKWGGAKNDRDPSGYIAAWRRLHRIFTEQGATNVAWVWSPNWNSTPHQAWNSIASYYPGDRYVDWVGVSGYNLRRESPATLFEGIDAAYGTRKPIMIAEVGAVDRGGRTKADWITEFSAWVRQHPAIGAVVWFDTDTHPGTAEEYRIDSDPAALAAYRAMVSSPTFHG